MSLLTSDDSKKTSQMIRHVVNYYVLLSIISYLAGLAYFASLIHQPDKSYFSDNALLPGLATREFIYSQLTTEYLFQLENVTKISSGEGKLPIQYLKEEFSKHGSLVHEHNFVFRYPFGLNQPLYHGTNLYAIFRAPRAPSTEAIIISSPYRSALNSRGSTLPSISLMLSLAKFFSTKMYWAKDIIFLIGDKELVGIQAWLNSYHGLNFHSNNRSVLQSDSLLTTSGVIQAALNLELSSFTPSSIELKIEGINGQLPNLDLFNVAVELCNREGVSATFHGDSFYHSSSDWENWLRNSHTIASMMATQATTLPTGAHGLFQKFAIQAITLETKQSKDNTNINQSKVGRAIEGIVRSLNNMLERFNRSYYFYLLTSTRRFISIGFYMITFALLAFPLALRALHFYFDACDYASNSSNINSINLWLSFQPNFMAHLSGIMLLSIVPLFLSRMDQISQTLPLLKRFQDFPTHDIFFIFLITLNVMSLFPYGLIKYRKSAFQLSIQSMVALLNCLLLFACISLINISLALALTVVYVPLVLLVLRSTCHPNRFFAAVRRTLQTVLLLLIHPLVLHYICLLTLSFWKETSPDTNCMQHLNRTLLLQRKTILNYIEDWYLYDNWTFVLFSLFLYPVWLQLWYISLVRVYH